MQGQQDGLNRFTLPLRSGESRVEYRREKSVTWKGLPREILCNLGDISYLDIAVRYFQN